MNKIKLLLLRTIATKKFQPLFKWLHWLALKGMNYGSANSPLESGEVKVLEELVNELPDSPIVFDVGANRGQYLDMVVKKWRYRNPTFHVFEPDSLCCEILSRKYGAHKNIVINNFALGREAGKAKLYSSKQSAVSASLVNSGMNGGEVSEIDVQTIDQYCQVMNISTIDFLKIDTEGYEMNVLEGAMEMIGRGSIRYIQFEHGSLQSIIMGASLYRYSQLLRSYELYHIKQDGLFKIKILPINEIYYNSNYVFKLKLNKYGV